MIERELIAERTIHAIDKDSREFEIRLMVGKPYEVSPTAWACPVAMVGLHGVFPDMYGVDSWQALLTSLNLIGSLLNYFVEDGGRIFFEKDGDQIDPDELFSDPPETPVPDPPLSTEQQDRVELLTAEELQRIDDSLMADASTQWRKVARIVGSAMTANRDSIKDVPDVFYSSRVRKLVEAGRLVSAGNLDYMRFSEVKLPE